MSAFVDGLTKHHLPGIDAAVEVDGWTIILHMERYSFRLSPEDAYELAYVLTRATHAVGRGKPKP